jgi:hypothetical protein
MFYCCPKTVEKRALIALVFSNLSLHGEKLRVSLAEPFATLAKISKSREWQSVIDTIRNQYYQETLVVFQLIPPSLARFSRY